MWAHKAWQGTFLPSDLRRDEQLPAYASWCTAVEGNTTAYGVPSPATIQSWAAGAPDDFRFWFKLPQTITHLQRLRDVDADVRAFAELLAPLGRRAEMLVVQLPASFGPPDIDALATVLARVPAGHRFGVEVRNAAFFAGGAAERALHRLLERHDAEWITFDTTAMFASPPTSDAEREAWEQKPRLPRKVVAVGEAPAVRILGRDADAATIAAYEAWIPVFVEWLAAGRTPTAFIHSPDNTTALGLARHFHADVREAATALGIEVDPLPKPVEAPPATLF
jgi:uncharacterized protein YecE (DUF72 family)